MDLVEINDIGSQALEAALANSADIGSRQVARADLGGDDGFGAAAF